MKQLIFATIVLSCSMAYAIDPPPQGPPTDPAYDNLVLRVNSLEQDVAEIKQKLGIKEATVTCDCPCPDGVCICKPGECPCEDCPKHKNVKGFVKEGTKWKSNTPTNEGLELLYFGADWCANCPGAISRLGDMTEQAVYVDCTNDNPLAEKYGITAFPTLIAIQDGRKVNGKHTEGSSVGKFLAGRFLEKTQSRTVETQNSPVVSNRSVTRYSSQRWTWPGDLRSHLQSTHGVDVSGLSQSELQAVHDNLHNGYSSGIGQQTRTTTRYSYGTCSGGSCGGSVRYMSTGRSYAPTVYRGMSYSYGSCPNCAR